MSTDLCKQTPITEDPLILRYVEGLGHAAFRTGEWNLNLIGERRGLQPDAFDDRIHAVYKAGGSWWWWTFPATTDPGLKWLREPMNVRGTAILVPGQYRGSHAIGMHQRRYAALVQVGELAVYRDGDRDDHLRPSGTIYRGTDFGINVHRAHSTTTTSRVGAYSAGCQVVQVPDHFARLMTIAKRSTTQWGPRITYTLIDTVSADPGW